MKIQFDARALAVAVTLVLSIGSSPLSTPSAAFAAVGPAGPRTVGRVHLAIAQAPAVTTQRATHVIVPKDLKAKLVPGTAAYRESVAQTRALGLDPNDPQILAKWRARVTGFKPPAPPTPRHRFGTLAFTRRIVPAGMERRVLERFSGRGFFNVMDGKLTANDMALQHSAQFTGAGSTPIPQTPVTGSAATQPPNANVTPKPPYMPGVAAAPKAPEIMHPMLPDAWPHPVVTSIEIDGGTQTSFHEGDTILIKGSGLGGFSEGYHVPFAPKIKVDFGDCGSFYLKVDQVGDDGTWVLADGGDPKVDGILPVDKREKGGYLLLSTPGGAAPPVGIVYNAWLADAHEAFRVANSTDYHPHGISYGTDDLGMIAARDFITNFSGGRRSSCCPAWMGGQGDTGLDNFGFGDELRNDWRYLSVQVTPYDFVGTSGKDYYAGSTTTPDGVSLRTTIEWFYQPSHSIQYDVDMLVEGPVSVRAADSMGPVGLCGD